MKLTVKTVFSEGVTKPCQNRVFVVIVKYAPRNGRVMDLVSLTEPRENTTFRHHCGNHAKTPLLDISDSFDRRPVHRAVFDTLLHGFDHCDTVLNQCQNPL